MTGVSVAGFTGADCEVNVDDCSAHKCANGATCVDAIDGYTCDCLPQWTGIQIYITLDTISVIAA